MLELKIVTDERWNETTEEFVEVKSSILQLEHSLISIKKWESAWKKPYLTKEPKTDEESLDYIRKMTIKPVDESVYQSLSGSEISQINKYIDDSASATTITNNHPTRGKSEILTAEVIYYLMDSYQINWTAEKWHINSLLMLIQVHAAKSEKPQKESRNSAYARQNRLNAARRGRRK